MARPFAHVPGPIDTLPTPPLDPRSLNALLRHRPERALAVIAAMSPAQRHAQLVAQLIHATLPPERLKAAYTELGYDPCPDSLATPLPAAPIEPLTLGRAEPDEARQMVAALSPSQRVAQAVAQAAWLTRYGYPVTAEEILAVFEGDLGDSAT